jgi:hypothetical protein
MGAAALYAIQAGAQGFQSINEAFKAQALAELQVMGIERQMSEMQQRNQMQQKAIEEKGSQAIAEQTAAFVQSGVKLTGSPMTVLSDTIADAAEAAYIQQRETDYTLTNLAVDKSIAERAASNQQLILNIAAGAVGAAGTYAKSLQAQNSGVTKNRGAFNAAQAQADGAPVVSTSATSYGLGDAYV